MQSNSKAVYVHVLHLGIKWKFAVRKNVNRGPLAHYPVIIRHLSCFFRAIFNFLFAKRYHISLKVAFTRPIKSKKAARVVADCLLSVQNLDSTLVVYFQACVLLASTSITTFCCNFKASSFKNLLIPKAPNSKSSSFQNHHIPNLPNSKSFEAQN